MEWYLEDLGEKLEKFGRHTMIRGYMKERCHDLAYLLDLAGRGWENWKAQLPKDLHVCGLDRERIYEVIVEQAMDWPALSLMEDMASTDVRLLVFKKGDGVLIRVARNGGYRHEISIYENDEGDLVVDHHNKIYDKMREEYPDIDELLDYDPSFK